MVTLVISGSVLFFLRYMKVSRLTAKSVGVCAANGILNRLGNYLLVVALMNVEASVQYPMVTGGVIIVSTFAAFCTRSRPSKRELLSVVFAFCGTLSLFVIPV
jgi:drug/metabolite transporter (DMT)-like permease